MVSLRREMRSAQPDVVSRADGARLLGFVVVGVVALALVRWGHHTPDSVHYLRLARSLGAGVLDPELKGPFGYRLFAPAVASLLPVSKLDHAFALENTVFSAASGGLILALARRLGASRGGLATVAVLYIVSFPTLNYSSGVLSDPAGLLFFCLSLVLILQARWALALGAVAVGMLARETVGVVAGVAVVVLAAGHRNKGIETWLWCLAFAVAPLGVALLARELIGELPASDASPSLGRLQRNLSRPVSWATVALTIGPLLTIVGVRWRAVAGYFEKLELPARALLTSGALGVLLVFVFGTLSAFMSGRFLWPAYAIALPCVAAGLSGTAWERGAARMIYW